MRVVLSRLFVTLDDRSLNHIPMRLHALIVYLCLCTLQTLVAQTTALSPDQLLSDLISSNKVAGISAGFATNNSIKWMASNGVANIEKDQKFEVDTKVRTASIAKSMTAVAVMQLVEKGLVDLDKPIDIYIPEFIQKHDTKITTRHLLSHTSGISAYKNVKETENRINYRSLREVYDVFKDRKLRFQPGTDFYYTSYGYVLLGILIEKVTGMSYERYMTINIWDKAGMVNTGIENRADLPENMSALFTKTRKGKIDNAKANDLSNRIPGGGLYSTVKDILNFGIALLDGKLVSPETLEIMTTHHSLEKYNNGYGFGFYLYGKTPNENSIYGHNGAQTGASGQLFLVPSLNLVTVALSNTSGAGFEISTIAAQLIDWSQK
jgi:CubicO group peptidase (beta-lactamase class C family)